MFTVQEITSKKPLLEHLPNDVLEVEKTIRELDDGYRFFYNHKHKRYEVHNINNQGSSICLVAKKLDGRIVKRVYKSYVPYNWKEVDQMDEYNEMIKKAEKKREQDIMEDMKKDMKKPIEKAVMRDETHSGYNNFHIMPERKEGVKNDNKRLESGCSTNDGNSNTG